MADLQTLLVDKAELDRELLTEVLLPLLGVDSRTKELVPKERWSSLSQDGKLIAFLLGRKAMANMPEVALQVEGCAPKEIEEATGIPGGTLRPKLVAMRKSGLLAQDQAGRYYVPTHAVLRAKQVIVEVKNDGQKRASASIRRSRRSRRGTS